MKRSVRSLVHVFVLGCMTLAGCSGEDQVANIDTALSTIMNFEQALAVYRLDAGKYPSSKQGLGALVAAPDGVENWNGPYLEGDLPLDPWGKPYVYEYGAEIYRILSAGPDGELDTEDDLVTQRATTKAKDKPAA